MLKAAIVCSLCLSLAACGQRGRVTSAPPQVVEGVLDLRDWDFEQHGIISLNGNWEFYWQQLLFAEDFESGQSPLLSGYIPVPDAWNSYRIDHQLLTERGGQRLTGDGFATYRLHILLNDNQPALGLFAVDTPLPIPTAHNFYVNGILVGSDGLVGPTAETMRPHFNPYVAIFDMVHRRTNLLYNLRAIWFPPDCILRIAYCV